MNKNPNIKTANTGNKDARVTTPNPVIPPSFSLDTLEIPIPSAITNGTVTGPVVTAPQSKQALLNFLDLDRKKLKIVNGRRIPRSIISIVSATNQREILAYQKSRRFQHLLQQNKPNTRNIDSKVDIEVGLPRVGQMSQRILKLQSQVQLMLFPHLIKMKKLISLLNWIFGVDESLMFLPKASIQGTIPLEKNAKPKTTSEIPKATVDASMIGT
jgi:hypothetical protein